MSCLGALLCKQRRVSLRNLVAGYLSPRYNRSAFLKGLDCVLQNPNLHENFIIVFCSGLMNAHNMRRTQYGGCACVLNCVDHYTSLPMCFLNGKLGVVKVQGFQQPCFI
jgi:hypothetical protein